MVVRYLWRSKILRKGFSKKRAKISPEVSKEQRELTKYDKVALNFDYEYDRCNPVTAESSTKKYLEWVKSKLYES